MQSKSKITARVLKIYYIWAWLLLLPGIVLPLGAIAAEHTDTPGYDSTSGMITVAVVGIVCLLMSLLIFNEMWRKLTLDDTTLTVRHRLLFRKVERVDLSKIVDVTPLNVRGAPSSRRAGNADRYALLLKDLNGQSLRLQLKYFSTDARFALLPYIPFTLPNLTPETKKTAIATIKQTWYGKRIAELPDAVSSTSIVYTDALAARKKEVRRQTIIVSSSLVVLFIAMITTVLMLTPSSSNGVSCTVMQQRGIVATARVNSLDLINNYHRLDGRLYTDNINDADAITLHVTFTANSGATYTEPLYVDYSNQGYLVKAYNEAETGTVQVRYLPGNPASVRLESAFVKGAPIELCENR